MCAECKIGITQAPVYKVNCTQCKIEPIVSQRAATFFCSKLKQIAMRNFENSCQSMMQNSPLVLSLHSPCLYLRMRSQMALRAQGSTPAVGSSRMTALEPPTKAMATDSFLFIPPDNVCTKLWRLLDNSRSTIILVTHTNTHRDHWRDDTNIHISVHDYSCRTSV